MLQPKDKVKGKGPMVDQDGFQAVHRKSRGAGRNIFGGQGSGTSKEGEGQGNLTLKEKHGISDVLKGSDETIPEDSRPFGARDSSALKLKKNIVATQGISGEGIQRTFGIGKQLATF